MSAASITKPKKPNPYAHAPRLPEGDAPLDLGQLVRADFPLEVEVGPGRGGFLYERLTAVPELSMLGFEIRRKYATLVDDKLKVLGFGQRARVFSEDARQALRRFPVESVARVFVHFPDPWWKKRHEKRLVVGDALLPEVVRILRPGGELFVQTDVEERAEQYEAAIAQTPGLVAVPGGPRITENPFQARSPREHRAIKDGLPIYRLLYRRT
jgi:tRNA (guanine-N7-)-methyltransferase